MSEALPVNDAPVKRSNVRPTEAVKHAIASRLTIGLSQGQVALEFGVSRQTVNAISQGMKLATEQVLGDWRAIQRDKAVIEATESNKKAADLTEKLTRTTQEKADAQAKLAAYVATGLTPEQILGFNKLIKGLQNDILALQDEKTFFAKQLAKTQAELDKYTKKDYHGPENLPASLSAKVLVADPKWEFVVLDLGEDRGVLKDTELLVSRGSKLVAKVRVTSVQKDRCIANVMDGWRVGDVIEGDVAIPAYPASGSL